MAITNPTANLFLDTRTKLKKTGKHPVKLTVYFTGEKKRYGLPYSFTEDEWKKLNAPKLRDNTLKESKIKLDYFIGDKFQQALKKIEGDFDFEKFKSAYFDTNKRNLASKDVYAIFNRQIKEFTDSGNIGTATIYKSALKTFQGIRKRLTFDEVTVTFLEEYERKMAKSGHSVTYIAMNLRNLRTIYNIAIAEKLVNADKYPFSKTRNDKKYKIKKGESNKRALTIEELRLLKNFRPKSYAQRKAWLLWWFSFYANGLNTKDICLLKNKNISGNTITITRAKTENTNSNVRPIQIFLSDEIKGIINEIGNQDKTSEAYIFVILKHGITPKEERGMIMSFTRNINKHMKKISVELKFDFVITTIWARHSFSTYLKRCGVSVDVISEALGHTSTETTQNYLDSFNLDTLEKTAGFLAEI
ncbi:MAG: site-specific integrase [Bacteroidales bacterium]|nr:site-specific integrase [Bacteroidales bacterium]